LTASLIINIYVSAFAIAEAGVSPKAIGLETPHFAENNLSAQHWRGVKPWHAAATARWPDSPRVFVRASSVRRSVITHTCVAETTGLSERARTRTTTESRAIAILSVSVA